MASEAFQIREASGKLRVSYHLGSGGDLLVNWKGWKEEILCTSFSGRYDDKLRQSAQVCLSDFFISHHAHSKSICHEVMF